MEFHVLSSSASLDIVVKTRAKTNIWAADILLFYVLQLSCLSTSSVIFRQGIPIVF